MEETMTEGSGDSTGGVRIASVKRVDTDRNVGNVVKFEEKEDDGEDREEHVAGDEEEEEGMLVVERMHRAAMRGDFVALSRITSAISSGYYHYSANCKDVGEGFRGGDLDLLHSSDFLGRTAVHVACMHGQLECAKILVRCEQDLLRQLGIRRTIPPRTKFRQEEGAEKNYGGRGEEVKDAPNGDEEQSSRVLLVAMADMMLRTPLHYAVYNNNLECASFLVSCGAPFAVPGSYFADQRTWGYPWRKVYRELASLLVGLNGETIWDDGLQATYLTGNTNLVECLGNVGVVDEDGRWYYEVTMGKLTTYFGWSNYNNKQKERQYTFSYDGRALILYCGTHYKEYGCIEHDEADEEGETTFGCELDRTNDTISFYRNGKPLGVAFRHVPRGIKLFPWVMMTQFQRCKFNFGLDSRRNFLKRSSETRFKFEPEGVRPLHDLLDLSDQAVERLRRRLRQHNTFIPEHLWDLGTWRVQSPALDWAISFARDESMLDLLLGNDDNRDRMLQEFAADGARCNSLYGVASYWGNATSLEYLMKLKRRIPEEQSFALGMTFRNDLRNDVALMWWAACAGSVECVKILIENGAPFAEPVNGSTWLHIVSLSNTELLSYVFERATNDKTISANIPEDTKVFDLPDKFMRTPLIRALRFSNYGVARYLACQLGADMTIATDRGENALACAIEYKSLSSAKMLIDEHVRRGGDLSEILESRDQKGEQIVHLAARSTTDILRLILSYRDEVGAPIVNVHAVNTNADTPLHLAISYRSVGNVRLLLEAGAVISTVSASGTVADVPFAFAQGDLAVVRELMEHLERQGQPIDLHQKGDNFNFLLAAMCSKHPDAPELVQFLLDQGVAMPEKTSYCLSRCVTIGTQRVLKTLMSNGHALDDEDEIGRTPLGTAVFIGSVAKVDELLKKGARGGWGARTWRKLCDPPGGYSTPFRMDGWNDLITATLVRTGNIQRIILIGVLPNTSHGSYAGMTEFDVNSRSYRLQRPQGIYGWWMRHGHSATLVGDCIFVFGGRASYGSNRFLNDLHIIDTAKGFQSRQQHLLGEMDGRDRHSAVLVGRLLYIFGGANRLFYWNDMWTIDVDTFECKRVRYKGGRLPSPRAHTPLIPIETENGCELWLFGGDMPSSAVVDPNWHVFDTETQCWTTVVPKNPDQGPPSRWGHRAWLRGNEIVIMGGYTIDSSIQEGHPSIRGLYTFNIDTWEWRNEAVWTNVHPSSMLFCHTLVRIADDYVVCAFTGDGTPCCLDEGQASNLLGNLGGLFEDGHYADVAFRFDESDEEVLGHRVVLAHSSNHFRNLFINQPELSVVHVADVKPEVWRHLLHFIYTGRIDWDQIQGIDPHHLKPMPELLELVVAAARRFVPERLAQLIYRVMGAVSLNEVFDDYDGRRRDYRSVFNDMAWSDVRLVCEGDKVLHAPKALLSVNPYFDALMRDQLLRQREVAGDSQLYENQHDHPMQKIVMMDEVRLSDMSLEDFYSLWLIIAAGRDDTVSIRKTLLHKWLEIGDRYVVEEVKDNCEAPLIAEVDEDTVFDLLQLADTFTAQQLKQRCIEFISLAIMRNPSFARRVAVALKSMHGELQNQVESCVRHVEENHTTTATQWATVLDLLVDERKEDEAYKKEEKEKKWKVVGSVGCAVAVIFAWFTFHHS